MDVEGALMLTVPALKVQQFNQEFFLLNLAAADVERLVRFEVLGDAGVEGKKPKKKASSGSAVNWSEIEQKVSTSDKAYQRPILRKKIEELAQYYLLCRDDAGVPAIPGAVLLTSDEPVTFAPQGSNPFVGLAQLTETEGTLRVLDGQHRLLALTALMTSKDLSDAERAAVRGIQVPAILFAGLPPPSVVEMFATINSKHTRLNASLLFSLKGRQLYGDPLDAHIHDVIKSLNDKKGSPLEGHIKMLGVGDGKVAQAGLANEMKSVLLSLRAKSSSPSWVDELSENLAKFYGLYFHEVARAFEPVWTSKKHSVRTAIALRAFIQASGEVASRVWDAGGDPRPVMRALIDPWRTRIGSDRFETAGAWRAKAAGGGKETTRLLARELVAGLGSPTTTEAT